MTTDERYRFGPFLLDVPTRALLRDGEALALPAKGFDTLLALVRHRDRVVPKDELLRMVWPDAFVSDDSLTQSVSVLRRTLGDSSAQPQFIATVPRRGYRFVAAVDAISDTTTPAEGVPTAEDDAMAAPAVTPPAVVSSVTPTVIAHRRTTRRWAAASVGILAVAAALLLMVRTGTTVPRGVVPAGTIRFILDPPDSYALASGAALSPDGHYLTFVARQQGSGRPQLWVRSLESPDLRVLPGTEGAFRPFWSPDGSSIGFFASGSLKRVRVTGGAPQTLASVGYRPSGGTWSSSGVILFSDRQSQLFSVPATGGEPVAVSTLNGEEEEVAHQAPTFLPDGRHFLYFAATAKPEQSATYVGSLDSNERVRVLDASASSPIYAPPGYLLYVRDGVLVAQRFDTSRLRLTGAPTSLAPSTAASPDLRVGVISASTTGLLTFGGDTPSARLVWFSREGKALGTIEAPVPLHNPAMSPDHRYIAADASGSGPRSGIWLIDLARNTPTRFSEGILPVWGPQGAELSYTVPHGAGQADLLMQSVSGPAAPEKLIVGGPVMKIGGNWTPRHELVYTSSNRETRLDLFMLPARGRAPVPYLQTPFNEMHGQVSPDGHWIAYASDESGTWEIYLQTFPVPGGKRMVSVGGGAQPQWRKDGRELYYMAPDGTLMAVGVTLGTQPIVARPTRLFRPPITADTIAYRNQYAVDGDGQRFLFDAPGEREPINVVVNWNALLAP